MIRTRYLIGLMILGGLHAAVGAAAGPPSITLQVELDRSQIHIGERVRYTITVESDKAVEVTMPEFGERLGAFAIKDFGAHGPRLIGTGRVRRTQWYLLDTFLLGEYAIPPAKVRYRAPGAMERFLESPALFLKVEKRVATPDSMKDVRDIQEVVDLPSRFWLVVLLVCGGTAALIVLVLIGVRLFRRWREGAALAARRAAHEIAYEQLERLQRANLVAAGKIKEYYFRLSEIVRYYIQNRFGVYAPDMTTEEFLDAIARARTLLEAHAELVRRFLQHCDLVKFAKYNPEAFEIQEAFLSARRLVDETREVEAETPQDHAREPAAVGTRPQRC